VQDSTGLGRFKTFTHTTSIDGLRDKGLERGITKMPRLFESLPERERERERRRRLVGTTQGIV
jgi:hypothetical protein